MKEIKLDLCPAYISFELQSTDGTGLKVNPAATPTVSIYEESGADATYDNSMIAGSPFNCAIINAKVGNYGKLVSKALFTAGKIYRVLFEWEVDGIDTAFEENFLATNASQMKADVSALATEGNATANAAAVIAEVDENEVKIDAVKADTVSIESKVDDVFDNTNDIEAKVDLVQADTTAILADTDEMQGKLPAAAIAGEAEATVNAAAVIAEVDANEVKIDYLTEMLKYLNGKVLYNVATVAVPARNVEVGMVESYDMSISATQVLHILPTYDTSRHTISSTFTVV